MRGLPQNLDVALAAKVGLKGDANKPGRSLTERQVAGPGLNWHKRPVSPASVRGVTPAAASPASLTGSAEEPPPPHAYLDKDRQVCFRLRGPARRR